MLIMITSTPPGDSPDWVRDTWVGMTLRTVKDDPVTVPTMAAGRQRGSRFGQFVQVALGKAKMRTGYLVNARDAVGLMALENEDAALWCIENTPMVLDPSQVILFDSACCRPLG